MPLDGWFRDVSPGGDARTASKPAKVQWRTELRAARGALETRPAPYRHGGGASAGKVGVLGALDARSSERLTTFVGQIAVTALALLSFYTLVLSILPKSTAMLTINFAITPLIIAMFAAGMGPVVLYSGLPRSFFGLQTDNWKSALTFSVLVSLAFLAAAAALKLILIHTTETFSCLCVLSVADVRENMHPVRMSPLYWVAAGLYLVLTPVQEFVVRCGLQAPLYAFLSGTGFRRHVWSLLVSNLVFAAAHSHIGVAFAAAAFIPGLFWGWIFARTNSLIAAAASHFIIGGAGIFLFGIEEVVAKLVG